MEKAIKVINELQEKGIINDYAIGGGIAVIFYAEPILTYDLDIFFTPVEEKKLVSLSPIYNYCREKGYSIDKEHIIIEGLPVQFIPVYNELVQEAVKNAVEKKYKKTKTKTLKPEYLIAIMLQTFRPKDKERMMKLIEETKINNEYLKKILQKHKLDEKYKQFVNLYYGKK